MQRDVNILYYVFHHTVFVKIYQIPHLKFMNLLYAKYILVKLMKEKNEKKKQKVLKISNDSFQSSPKIYYSPYF